MAERGDDSMKEKEMKLSLHLAELRKRVFRIVAVLVVTMVGGLLTANDILAYLRSVKPADAVSWHVFSPWDSIRLYMQIAFIVSVGLSSLSAMGVRQTRSSRGGEVGDVSVHSADGSIISGWTGFCLFCRLPIGFSFCRYA